MEENKKDEISEVSLNFDALTDTEEKKDTTGPDVPDPEISEAEADVTEYSESEKPTAAESTVSPQKKQREKARQKDRAPKPPKPARQPRPPRTPAVPIEEPALPMLACAVVFVISLFTLIANKLIHPFSSELLAPAILQTVTLIIPAYLVIMLGSADKSLRSQLKEIGCRPMSADHVFFMIFAALFTICSSLVLTLVFWGAPDASRGITLLGTFTAGVNEYTVAHPYLILTYVLIPAIAEEILFRGVVFSRIEKVSFPFAALVSCLISALYGFSLGGIIPSLFTSAVMVFVLYTTNSLIACMIVHALVNLYRLFLEANISAYFLTARDNFLLFITVAIALAIASLLFFTEGARIFREKAQLIAEGKAKSAKKSKGIKQVFVNTRSMLAYTPTLVFTAVCGAAFVSAVIINFITR